MSECIGTPAMLLEATSKTHANLWQEWAWAPPHVRQGINPITNSRWLLDLLYGSKYNSWLAVTVNHQLDGERRRMSRVGTGKMEWSRPEKQN